MGCLHFVTRNGMSLIFLLVIIRL